jgi:hypothetical protein
LDLNELAGAGTDDVDVAVRAYVLLVAQVEHRLAVDHPHRDGGDRADQRLRIGLEQLLLPHPRHRVGQSDPGSSDGGSPGTSVSLKDVAVEHDRALAEQ